MMIEFKPEVVLLSNSGRYPYLSQKDRRGDSEPNVWQLCWPHDYSGGLPLDIEVLAFGGMLRPISSFCQQLQDIWRGRPEICTPEIPARYRSSRAGIPR